jgi:hypothetical protein
MIRNFSLVSSVTALMLAMVAALLSVPGRTASLYSEMELLASSVVPASNALSTSIAAHPAEMIPP